MMRRYDEESYKRYRQYQNNKYRYKQEQMIVPLAAIFGICLLLEYWYLFLMIVLTITALTIYKVLRKRTKMKTTETGYINKNNQKNIGSTNKQGTDYNQKFYNMQCLNCNYKYFSNGSDIWQRKCPNCQGGKQ